VADYRNIDCAFVAGELAFSFHIASACDVCCDLRRRRRRRKKKSFLDTGSIGTLRKIRRKLVLEKQKISWSTTKNNHIEERSLLLRNRRSVETEEYFSQNCSVSLFVPYRRNKSKETSSRKGPWRIILHKWILQKLR